jgi:hypothetical protein
VILNWLPMPLQSLADRIEHLAGAVRPAVIGLNGHSSSGTTVEMGEPTRLARDAERVVAGEVSAASYARWMAEENAYVTDQRPWEDADLVINGGDTHRDRDSQILIAEGWRKLRT